MSGCSGFLFRRDNGVACAVYVPRDVRPRAALLFLHGRGECGRNGTLHLRVGLPAWIMREPERWPFVVVMPQKPEQLEPWHRYERLVLSHLDDAVAEHGVDPGRVGITGLSQGGNGTLRIAANQPRRFAAAASVCGFARFYHTEPESDDAAIVADVGTALAGMPMRLYHGEADDVILPDESRKVHAALREAGSDALLELYPGVNHNAWDPAYGSSDLAEWFAAVLR